MNLIKDVFMKRIFNILMCCVMSIALSASCSKTPVESGDDVKNPTENPGVDEDENTPPSLKEVSLSASPSGATLEFKVKAKGDWTLLIEDCDWVTPSATSGTGETTIQFVVDQNDGNKDRSVLFYITEGKYDIYEIFISQVKSMLPINQEDMDFLKWLVDNKAYGDATPVVDDWYTFMPDGFTGISFDVDAAGKMFISAIDFSANADNTGEFFNSFPPTINLPNLTKIYVNYQTSGLGDGAMDVCPLKGSEFPREWNCPLLEKVHLERVGMVGTIPASFAALPNLRAFFVRSCDFYGALPHDWASDKIESIIIGFTGATDCPNLGYMVPASLDVVLNSEKQQGFFNDPNEFKLGGTRTNWVGFENGWGQERYVKFGGGAEGDLYTWSDYRSLTMGTDEENAVGGIRNPLGTDKSYLIDSWGSVFANIVGIPTEMHEWDQAAADAYTAEAAHRARLYKR